MLVANAGLVGLRLHRHKELVDLPLESRLIYLSWAEEPPSASDARNKAWIRAIMLSEHDFALARFVDNYRPRPAWWTADNIERKRPPICAQLSRKQAATQLRIVRAGKSLRRVESVIESHFSFSIPAPFKTGTSGGCTWGLGAWTVSQRSS
jgi:hypothetical protein